MLTQALRYNAGRIRVKDCPFGQPDGTANQFQLVDRHGHAVTQDARIASIHQTDWQGRVELSSEPRTNVLSGHNGGPFVTVDATPYLFPSGTSGGVRLTHVPGSNTGYDQMTFTGGSRPSVNTQVVALIEVHFVAGNGTFGLQSNFPGEFVQYGNCQTGEAISQYMMMTPIADGSYLCRVILPAPAAAYSFVGAIFCTVSGEPPPASQDDNAMDIGAVSVFVGGSSNQATTPFSTTVTDYTHDGQGGITTGQVPAADATLDWTGTARRAA